jgi:hypothetical protein
MKLSRNYLFSLLFLLCTGLNTAAQNIVGMKIMIGADAPAFIAFPSEVTNARWDNNEMNEFFKFSTRNENTMQISYNGKANPPANGTGFSVIQGKNTHIFTLYFKKDYDINKDPVLYYDFSDKGKLKAAAEQSSRQQQGALASGGNDPSEAPTATRDQEKEDKAQQEALRKEDEKRKREMAQAQQQRQKDIAAQQKAAAEKAKQEEKAREAEIAKAKTEAQRKEAEQKKAREEQEAIAKANEAAARQKAAEALRQKKEREAEEKRLALEAAQQKEKEKQEKDQAKAERDRIAREEAERKRMAAQQEKDRLAREKLEQEEAERQRKAALALEQAEAKRKAREEAEARLLALQQAREEARRNAAYTMAGLWNRYGKKGINLYEIPAEQHGYNNTDFYVAKDTTQNFEQSNIFLAEPARLDIAAESQQGISLKLKSISFRDAIAYYRIEVQNKGAEDYLVGANSLAWYHPDGSPKVFLKCSYLTYISFFPLVKPGETLDYIYATRAANINDEDKLVFTINERRPDRPKFEIFFDGSVYRKELARIEQPIGTTGSRPSGNERKVPKKEKKERGKKEKKEKENKDRGID